MPLAIEPVEMIKVAWEESALSAIIKSDYGDIELHTVHVPNASRNGRKTKVDTFDAIYKALAEKSEGHVSYAATSIRQKKSIETEPLYFLVTKTNTGKAKKE